MYYLTQGKYTCDACVWSTRFDCNLAAAVRTSNKVSEEKVLQVMS